MIRDREKFYVEEKSKQLKNIESLQRSLEVMKNEKERI